nr:hypothetical protein [Sphingomonas jinjuensis]
MAGLDPADDQVLARSAVEHRHAELGEAEMVGAVIAAAFRVRLWADRAALRGDERLDQVLDLGLAGADEHEVAGFADDVEAVHVDPADGARQREDRVFGVISAAEQAAFLRRHRDEGDRAPGRSRLGLRLGEADEPGDAAGIVERAVADVVAVHRIAAAQVIPMRGIEDIIVGRRGAGQDADDVLRHRLLHRIGEAARHLQPERHRPEPLGLGGRGKRGEVLAGAGEQLLGLGELHPADDLALAHMAVRLVELVLRAGPRRLDDRPGIGGRFGIVDDQRGGGAVLGGVLELVGPAAVPGHRAALERAVARHRLPVGVVDEDDDGLPLHVDAGIIVPALFGRGDAVTDEDDVAVRDVDPGRHAIGAGDHLGLVGHRHRRLATGEGQRADVLGGDLHHRHVLIPAALVAGLQPCRLEAFGDIRDRLRLARRRRRAALIGIGRQRLGDGLQRLGRDRWRRLRLGGGGE